MSNSPDQALIERCQRGDRNALEKLVGKYEGPVYNASFRFLGNSDDAADVTQTVFLKVFEHLDQYDPKYKFFSWIYRIAINESINQANRNSRKQPLREDIASSARGPEDVAQCGNLSREIQACLMKLQPHYRAVMVLRHFSESSYQEIGDILQIPEKTVKSRLYSARQLMRQMLMEQGIN